ncbi:MAG TPA: lytic transglycosylase, partial [Telluria sp.]
MTEPTRTKAALAAFALILAPALCLAEAGSADAAPAQIAKPAVPLMAESKVVEYKETDVWGRIRTGYAIPDINNALVAKHVTWYST